MTCPTWMRPTCFAFWVLAAGLAHADSFVSSASIAGSESSDSVSDSLHHSSRSSSGNDRRADIDYRILEVAATPGRAGFARLVLQSNDATDTVTLDLPQAVVAREALLPGDAVHSRRQVYGFEFARADTREAFFLALDDDWFDSLAARPVKL